MGGGGGKGVEKEDAKQRSMSLVSQAVPGLKIDSSLFSIEFSVRDP